MNKMIVMIVIVNNDKIFDDSDIIAKIMIMAIMNKKDKDKTIKKKTMLSKNNIN